MCRAQELWGCNTEGTTTIRVQIRVPITFRLVCIKLTRTKADSWGEGCETYQFGLIRGLDFSVFNLQPINSPEKGVFLHLSPASQSAAESLERLLRQQLPVNTINKSIKIKQKTCHSIFLCFITKFDEIKAKVRGKVKVMLPL